MIDQYSKRLYLTGKLFSLFRHMTPIHGYARHHYAEQRRLASQPIVRDKLLKDLVGSDHDDEATPGKIFDTSLVRHQSDQARKKLLTRKKPVISPPVKQHCVVSASPADHTYLSKKQTLALLTKIQAVLRTESSNKLVGRMLTELIASLTTLKSDNLTLTHWATLSLQLEKLLAMLNAEPVPMHSGISPRHFVMQNIKNLEFVCRFAWAKQAHEAIASQFARDIERRVVGNPVLLDTSTMTASLDVSTPIPFLSGGVAVSYQSRHHIDDEGNYITTKTVSGAVRTKADALVASAQAQGSVSIGSYAYCKTAQDHARYFFSLLFEKNKTSPSIARYTSRAATIAGPDIECNELSDFEHWQEDYQLRQQSMSQLFSVLLSLNYEKDDRTHAQIRARHAENYSARIKLTTCASPIIRPTLGVETNTAFSAGASAGVEVMSLRAGVSVQALYQRRVKDTHRVATLCELLRNPSVQTRHKDNLKNEIDRATLDMRKTVQAFWPSHSDRDHDYSHVEELSRDIDHLHKDFEAYFQLHAQAARGDAKALLAIEAFHLKYGVQSNEECLHCMVLLTAYFYSRLMNRETDELVEQLKMRLLKLEQTLHTTAIPHRRGYLEQHAVVKQEIQTVSKEKFVQFMVAVGCTALPPDVELGVKISTRSLTHYNPLRSGEYVNVEFTLGSSTIVNERILQTIGDYFSAGQTGLNLFFDAGAYTKRGAYTLRFFKPSAFDGLPYCKLHERRINLQSTQTDIAIPIPVTGWLNLVAGLSYQETSCQLVSEVPDSNTMLYFAMHYMHALSNGKTNKAGEALQDSYWYRLEREQGAALAHLFLNYADESHTVVQELEAIEQVWLGGATSEEVFACQAAKTLFLDHAKVFEQSRTDGNYQAALEGFKALQRMYFSHWQRKKESSPTYKEWRTDLI